MNSKSSLLIWAGIATIGILAGVTYAFIQPKPQASPLASASPTATETQQQIPQPNASSTNVTEVPRSETAQTKTAPTSKQNTAIPTTTQVSMRRTLIKCVTSMVIVSDPNPPLNVRSSPTTNADNIVGQLKNNTFVTVVDQEDNWLQIKDPVPGWISKNRTENGCNQKVEKIQFAANTTSAKIRDRFIGTGSHEYTFQADQGQTMIVTVQEGPLPAVLTPDGKVLTSDPGSTEQTEWSGKLPTTGDYKLVMDSNFRGYDYTFTVQIE